MTEKELLHTILVRLKRGIINENDFNDLLNEIRQVKKGWEENKCESCIYSYHKKDTRGYHDVEEFYKE